MPCSRSCCFVQARLSIYDAGYDWCPSEETRDIVEDYFVQCFARGAVGSGYFMLSRFGKDFGLWSEYGDGSLDETMKGIIQYANELFA